jgi:hypothetical protein
MRKLVWYGYFLLVMVLSVVSGIHACQGPGAGYFFWRTCASGCPPGQFCYEDTCSIATFYTCGCCNCSASCLSSPCQC